MKFIALLKEISLSDFLLNNMIKAFYLLDVLWAASTWVMSKSVILVSKTIFWIIFDTFSFLLKGVPDIPSIKDELLYWASLLISIPWSFTTDFMLLSSWCNLVLSGWIFFIIFQYLTNFLLLFFKFFWYKVLAVFSWSYCFVYFVEFYLVRTFDAVNILFDLIYLHSNIVLYCAQFFTNSV